MVQAAEMLNGTIKAQGQCLKHLHTVLILALRSHHAGISGSGPGDFSGLVLTYTARIPQRLREHSILVLPADFQQ